MAVDFKPLTITPVEFSLTAGTNIPAPPDSPPQTPTKTNLPPLEEENEENADPKSKTTASTPDSKLQVPLSPMSATSQGSHKRVSGVRKFLSLRSLRNGHSDSRRESMIAPLSPDALNSRPGSPYTTTSTDTTQTGSLRHRKSTGWFGSTRRKSGMFVIGRLDETIANGNGVKAPAVQSPKGPPPPTIPEFALGKDLDMGGDDLFRNIKIDSK